VKQGIAVFWGGDVVECGVRMRRRLGELELFDHGHFQKFGFWSRIPPRSPGYLIVRNPIPHLQVRRERFRRHPVCAPNNREEKPVARVRTRFIDRTLHPGKPLDASPAAPQTVAQA